MSKIKVLGIIGSPRRNGNTETIVDKVLEGAKEAGAEIDKVILNELEISPCQACDACSGSGICQFNDGMDLVNEKMKESSIFVYGTPVYYWGPTAQFKVFMDRCLATSKLGLIKGKKVILVVPLGGSLNIARHTVGMINDSVSYQNAEIVAEIISPNTGETKDLRKEILAKAYQAGKDVMKKS
ncbi:MAG: flavodoxin family protein [Candidatus Heimdallarchaeota archaeon]